MDNNERIVFAHELRPNQRFRILVTGDLDKAMIDALKAFADFQSKLVAQTIPNLSTELYNVHPCDQHDPAS